MCCPYSVLVLFYNFPTTSVVFRHFTFVELNDDDGISLSDNDGYVGLVLYM